MVRRTRTAAGRSDSRPAPLPPTPMRDPLHRLSVKHKLTLMFIGLGLIAFGLGGFLISRSARGVLEREIHGRLSFQCQAYATALDSFLQMLTRRTEDFASDGHIRDLAERLSAPSSAADEAEMRAELVRHLSRNKLPLVAAFRDLGVVDLDGRVLVSVHDRESAQLRAVAAAAAAAPAGWYSGVLDRVPASGAPAGAARPGLAIATPLFDLSGSRRIGCLLAWVDAGTWIEDAMRSVASATPELEEEARISLHDAAGRTLLLPESSAGAGSAARLAAPESPPPARTSFVKEFSIAASGWDVEVILHAERALLSVSGLQFRFLLTGLVLALLSAGLMYFPIRFLARPLGEMEAAARRMSSGDLRGRVPVESEDEIGNLARSFNRMADAVEERTHRLETGAAELRAERDRLNTVIGSMHDGLLVLDADGQVVLSNAAAEPLVALRVAGASVSSRHVCHEEERLGDCLACLFRPEGPPRSCVVEAGGRTLEVHATLLAPDARGRAGRVLVARDISERVSQDEREIHQERLAVLGEVASVVAHELNNPLAAISMFNQMSAGELPEDSPLREHVDVIQRNTEACKRTIRELLDYATGASPETGPIDVHSTVADVVRFLRPISERAGVTLRTTLRALRPVVSGDEVQLRQVFVNLVMNAIQAMPGGGEVVLESREEGQHLIVDVRDDGPGIPPESREAVFRPFYTTKPRGTGTGLGLPTARRIAELHGGGLQLIESSAAGTTFRVRLRART